MSTQKSNPKIPLAPHLIWSISSIWNSSSVVPAGNPLFTRFPAHQTCLVSSPSTAVCCQWYWPQLWCLESPDSTFESILFFSRNHFPVDHTVEWLSVLSICESLCMCICIYVCTYLSIYLSIIYLLSIHQISLDHFSSLNLRLMDPSVYLISLTEYLPESSGNVQFLPILSKPALLSDLSIAENALSPLRKNHGIIFDSLSFTL